MLFHRGMYLLRNHQQANIIESTEQKTQGIIEGTLEVHVWNSQGNSLTGNSDLDLMEFIRTEKNYAQDTSTHPIHTACRTGNCD